MPRKTRKMRGGCDCAMKGGSGGQGQLLPDLSIRHHYPLNQYNEDPSRMIASDRLTPVKVDGGGCGRGRRTCKRTCKNKRLKRTCKKKGLTKKRGGNYLGLVNPGLFSGASSSVVVSPSAASLI